MDFISEAVKFFGYRYDSPEITKLLASGQHPHKADKPSDGAQYIISKEGGFDLLFEDKSAVSGRHQNRGLAAIFVYAAGADKHKEYTGPLPFGFSFSDSRSDLIGKKTPNRTWVIGKGRVAVNHPEPHSDTWTGTECNVHSTYWNAGWIHHFQITVATELREEDEWKAPPTWEDLALQPERKIAAIQLYKQENNVSTLEAKRVIDDYVSKHAHNP